MHSQLSNNKARESSTEVSKMRKYYKLFMCVVTVLSLIFLIFYKSQYDKLYNVLEVLDFFGPAKKLVWGKPQCNFTEMQISSPLLHP